ncbi:hypothetical protein B0T22DRAFT_485046 [Podospora appendiculata]|uniref:Uncharacterized protein n=1 Tax=Podospora appendiculata TaxID=314037 RepID=A0AAE0WZS1_9PEZI|nr:hypothetical protein B0T22DRAFT_485046 [Podospora appendiculata]
MRATAVFITLFFALAAAMPEHMMEERGMRNDCDCNEETCKGPPCCYNGTC